MSQTQTRRVTLQEAARILRVSEGAIRKRVKRGTLRHEKDPDGRLYIYLDAVLDEGVDDVPPSNNSALISELQSRVEFLESELQRKDAILLNMTEAVKALTGATPEPRGSFVGASEGSANAPQRQRKKAPFWAFWARD